MASNDHTIYVRQGEVTAPAEPSRRPTPAQNQKSVSGTSAIGTAIKSTVLIQGGKQIMNGVIGNIGEATGDYELQETAETVVSVTGTLVGLFAYTIPTIIITSVSVGFEIYATNLKQTRAQFKSQQAQVLTGKISVNGGRWL